METCPLTGRPIAAARALVGVSSAGLAKTSGISASKPAQLEAQGAALVPEETDADAIRRALEEFGAVFVAEGSGFGAGVRLKFQRDDVRQTLRLEGEGGMSEPMTFPEVPDRPRWARTFAAGLVERSGAQAHPAIPGRWTA